MNLWNRYMALVKPPQMTRAQRNRRLVFSSGLIIVGIALWFLADWFAPTA